MCRHEVFDFCSCFSRPFWMTCKECDQPRRCSNQNFSTWLTNDTSKRRGKVKEQGKILVKNQFKSSQNATKTPKSFEECGTENPKSKNGEWRQPETAKRHQAVLDVSAKLLKTSATTWDHASFISPRSLDSHFLNWVSSSRATAWHGTSSMETFRDTTYRERVLG